MHREVVMKRLAWFFVIPLLLFLMVACVQQINHLLKQQEARAGLEELIAELPQIDGFDTIRIVNFDSSFTAYGKTCYYAIDYLVIGSTLSEREALDVYTERLKSSGWKSEDRQYE